MEYNLMKIAERITDRREKLGISPIDLAQSIGVNYTTIYRYERGKIDKPKLPALAKIADALNCNIEYILGLTDDPYVNTVLNLEDTSDIRVIVNYVKDLLRQDNITLDNKPVSKDIIEKLSNAIDLSVILVEQELKKSE